ncbi:GntR family transcriptional regulator [Nocardiopsis sp. FR26]|uniref:GntR family transcriptional regulator n=1 Tax=Nocardiopsis sp. FR26 TaxID=2605987 RepID=UPI001357D30B|nr:GntR family transcriptional regulator [Nocardiopsis sp. FR26]
MSSRARWGTYQQIAAALRARITSGALAPGEGLSSEAELGREFAVSRTTVRRALAVLEEERLVVVVPGAGHRVATPQERQGLADARIPRHRVIAAQLRARIHSGVLAVGEMLPSEDALVREFGAARGTVRAALVALEEAGLVEVARGRGRIVRALKG